MVRFAPLTLKPEYFAKAFASIGKSINDASDDMMKELAETGAQYARTELAKAKYDGEHDAVVKVEKEEDHYSIVAYGSSVKFIEYGTGVKSISERSKHREVWRFSAKGRKITCTAGGKLAKYSKGGYTKERAYYTGPRSKRRIYINYKHRQETGYIVTGKSGEPRVQGKGQGYRTVTDKLGNETHKITPIKSYKVNFKTQDIPRKEGIVAKQSYITSGNEPNLCMKHTARYVGQTAPEVIRKHLKKI